MKKYLMYAAFAAVSIMSCNTGSEQDKMTVQDAQIGEINKEGEIPPSPPPKQTTASGESNKLTTDTASSAPNILQSGSPGNPDWEKKIIKTANITLELKDYSSFNNSIHSRLKGYGAYIAQEMQTEDEQHIQNELTIKVPVDRFEDLINSLSGEGVKELEKNISTEDVTGEVVDTKARLEAKKQVRARYLELLKQAKKMDDILQVQNEINAIQEEIEAADGRIDYLTHQSAYSTIHLKYYQCLNGFTADNAKPNFFTQLSEAFKSGTSVIMNFVLFAIAIWPLIVCGVILWVWIKRMKLSRVNVQK